MLNNNVNNYINSMQENVNCECLRLQEQEITFEKLTGMKINTVIDLFLGGYKLTKPDVSDLNDYNFKTGKRKIYARIRDAIKVFRSE